MRKRLPFSKQDEPELGPELLPSSSIATTTMTTRSGQVVKKPARFHRVDHLGGSASKERGSVGYRKT